MPGPAAQWDDDESTEVVNNADVGGFFGGRFRIDARLGAGAMGRVLTALDTETGSLVALKVLHRERSKDKNVLRRFAREAAALRAINHRAIVGIVASGRAPDGTPWLAMEHLTGQTLKTRIVKGGPMQPHELWPILKTLCEAVGEAHGRGVVHRDIKPDNIFLPATGDPACKILDFGLSTLNREGADKVTATGQLLGTPRYMAPELLASIGKPDHRVDVFALAVVAFEALTGRSLYSADDLGSLFGQILEARTYSLRQFRPELPEALEAVIRQGHARSMGDRFETATSFAAAFAAAAGIGDSVRQPQAPALANLFDDIGEGDGNAPLVDPFGAAPRPTGPATSAIGGPLPPMAHEVPPIVPPRERKSTKQGHGPDVSENAPTLYRPRTPPQAVQRPVDGTHNQATFYQPGPPASMPLEPERPISAYPPPRAVGPSGQHPLPVGAPAAASPVVAVGPSGAYAAAPVAGPSGAYAAAPVTGPSGAYAAAPAAPNAFAPGPSAPSAFAAPAYQPPPATAPGPPPGFVAAAPALGSGTLQGQGPGASRPSQVGAPASNPVFSVPPGPEPRFTAPPVAPAAVAPTAAQPEATPTRSRALGCALFTVAAIVVIAVAVAGAFALRWWVEQHGGL